MTPFQMAALHNACFETPRPWSAREFDALLSGPGIELATRDNGFAIARQIQDEAELLTLAVDPKHRRRGIARTLLTALEDRITAAQLILEVAENNSGAIAFYQALGFEQIGRRTQYYRRPDGSRLDALLFSKQL